MKKGIITMMALMLGMSGMMAQNSVVVAGAGDLTLRMGDKLEVRCDGSPITFTPDGTIMLTSYKDYDLTIPELRELKITGTGDVQSKGTLTFPYLNVVITGTGDADLTVECDTINALLTGVGDLKLNGHCRYLQATLTGVGDLDFDNFNADSISIVKTPRGKDHWDWNWESSKNGSTRHKTLLFRPHWDGFEAGLNMLLGSEPNADFSSEYALLEQRPLRSWNFNFNLAGIGLAFSHSHRVGLFTGIGLGWNNYSFNNPVRLEKGPKLICHAIDETAEEGPVKKSKLGVLYLQAPLMLEVRPTNKLYIDLGVTGGFRIDSWSKVKFQEGVKITTHNDYYINRFKLDASMRIGFDDFGFYANYNIMPLFKQGKADEAHTLSFGFSLDF